MKICVCREKEKIKRSLRETHKLNGINCDHITPQHVQSCILNTYSCCTVHMFLLYLKAAFNYP